jgi:hypothetical protein
VVENTGRGILFKTVGNGESTSGPPSSSIQSSNGGSVSSVSIGGGPLSYNYTLHHLQLHLSADTSNGFGGSEHRIAGQQFAGELQLIAFNSQLYSNYSEAESAPNGLTALALMVQPCTFEHPTPNTAMSHLMDTILTLAERGKVKDDAKSITVKKAVEDDGRSDSIVRNRLLTCQAFHDSNLIESRRFN